MAGLYEIPEVREGCKCLSDSAAEVLALAAGRKEIEVKNSKWLLVAGLVIMMMAVGCKKMGDKVDVAGTEAVPLVKELVSVGSSTVVGHVYVWDDVVNLHVKFKLDATQPPGILYQMTGCEVDVRLDPMEFPGYLTTIRPDLFLHQHLLLPDPGSEYEFIIPNVGGWMTGSTVAVAAHCGLRRWTAPDYFVLESGWAYDPAHPFPRVDPNCQGWWFPYTLEVPDDGEWHMNTAWGGKAYPNWSDWKFSGKNWALFIKYNVNLQTEYVGSLYAGNPKNDALAKVVGTVTVSDDVVSGVGNIYVKYTITKEDRAMFSGHTIVRGSLAAIPQAQGNPIPGQFDYHWGPFDPPEDGVTVTIPYKPAWGTNLFVAAHAEVGWFY
jgi:hypothetical protein